MQQGITALKCVSLFLKLKWNIISNGIQVTHLCIGSCLLCATPCPCHQERGPPPPFLRIGSSSGSLIFTYDLVVIRRCPTLWVTHDLNCPCAHISHPSQDCMGYLTQWSLRGKKYTNASSPRLEDHRPCYPYIEQFKGNVRGEDIYTA